MNSKTGMPSRLQSHVAATSGQNMANVRVHNNSPRPAQLQAQAYTQVSNIHLARGNAATSHEVGHVGQQNQGRVAATSTRAAPLNVGRNLERQADQMGARAASANAFGKPKF